jgi:hypothetical protein
VHTNGVACVFPAALSGCRPPPVGVVEEGAGLSSLRTVWLSYELRPIQNQTPIVSQCVWLPVLIRGPSRQSSLSVTATTFTPNGTARHALVDAQGLKFCRRESAVPTRLRPPRADLAVVRGGSSPLPPLIPWSYPRAPPKNSTRRHQRSSEEEDITGGSC